MEEKEQQHPINQRIKFLIDSMGMNVHRFASELGVKDGSIRNYLDRNSKPGADFLENLVRKFTEVNAGWLLTGEGAPYSTDTPLAAVNHSGDFNIVGTGISQKVKVNKGQAQDVVKQLEDCQRDVESLKQQLARADALIASKDETITLLRASYNRPN